MKSLLRSLARDLYILLGQIRKTSLRSKNKLLIRSQSQAGQESFVLQVLGGKRNGYYLEIGGHDGVTMSNTLILERNYGWSGLAIELDSEFCSKYNFIRSNKCLQLDATSADYQSILEDGDFPQQVDFLQVDIDPAEQSLAALKKIPFSNYRFSVITFEHDCYAVEKQNQMVLSESRKLLTQYGYQLVSSRIRHEGKEFEDWWIDPVTIPKSSYKGFISDSREGLSLFSIRSQLAYFLFQSIIKIRESLTIKSNDRA